MDLLEDPGLPPALLHCFEAGLLALAMLSGLAVLIPKLLQEIPQHTSHISIDDLDEVTFRLCFCFRHSYIVYSHLLQEASFWSRGR